MSDRLEEAVLDIRRRDSRYAKNAYYFVLEALDFTVQDALASSSFRDRHIGGRELLTGIRDFARERFGPMAREVFRQWGVGNTEDFGQIVFNLISSGLLQRRAQDSIEEFEDGYDFEREFETEYRIRVPWE